MKIIYAHSKVYGTKEILIDDEDYEELIKYKWSIVKDKNTFYARRWRNKDDIGLPFNIKMNRQIMGVSNPKIFVDHIDGNGLNNQRYNIRVATIGENNRNRFKAKKTLFPFKGISQRRERYHAKIKVNKKCIYLGGFKTIEDAARAYDIAAKKYHGEFANLNFK